MTPEQAATVAVIVWAGVSAVLTALLRLRSDADWLTFIARSPKLGFFVVFVRTLGIDPVGAIGALRLLFARGVAVAEHLPFPPSASPSHENSPPFQESDSQ